MGGHSREGHLFPWLLFLWDKSENDLDGGGLIKFLDIIQSGVRYVFMGVAWENQLSGTR